MLDKIIFNLGLCSMFSLKRWTTYHFPNQYDLIPRVNTLDNLLIHCTLFSKMGGAYYRLKLTTSERFNYSIILLYFTRTERLVLT